MTQLILSFLTLSACSNPIEMVNTSVIQNQAMSNPSIPTKITKIKSGMGIAEGTLLHPDGYLLFTEVRAGKIFKLDPETDQIELMHTVNGMPARLGFDLDGNLLFTDHKSRSIRKIDAMGRIADIAAHINNKRFNSPMTPLFIKNGTLLFTDPNFLKSGEKETPWNGFYRMNPMRKVELLSKQFAEPNALLINEAQTKIYIGDYGKNQMWVFDLSKDGDISDGKILIDLAKHGIVGHGMDGACFGPDETIYVTGGKGINVFSLDGELLKEIPCPEFMCNLAWNADQTVLYAGGYTSLYKITFENTHEKDYVITFVENFDAYEMPIEAAGVARLPKVSFSNGKLAVDYAYESGGEQRQGKMTLIQTAAHHFEGQWRTEADNGNVYSGDLYFDFKKDGTAEGKYTFGGTAYRISIKKN